MASNFDEMIDRRNTASLKWDVEENELPMWVADMDFATASCVLEAMKMENEIIAPADGTIIKTEVQQGSAVQTDDILVVIG